jgi:hypothetical protein
MPRPARPITSSDSDAGSDTGATGPTSSVKLSACAPVPHVHSSVPGSRRSDWHMSRCPTAHCRRRRLIAILNLEKRRAVTRCRGCTDALPTNAMSGCGLRWHAEKTHCQMRRQSCLQQPHVRRVGSCFRFRRRSEYRRQAGLRQRFSNWRSHKYSKGSGVCNLTDPPSAEPLRRAGAAAPAGQGSPPAQGESGRG